MRRLKDASRIDNHITPSCYGCVINAKHTQIWIWQCKRTVYYFPCDKTIHCICRKDRPMFWSFKAYVFIRRDSNWSPTILSTCSMFISRRFINKYQLISIVACQVTYPVCPELRILLCSAYLHLQSQKWHLFFGPFNTLQHMFDALFRHPDIKGIPQKASLLIDIHGWPCSKVFKKCAAYDQ